MSGESFRARIYARIVRNTYEPENDQACWRWRGRLDKEGYGHINLYVPGRMRRRGDNVTLKSHIVSWLISSDESREFIESANDLYLAYQELRASGLEIDHACVCTSCAFVDHLGLVTRKANVSLSYARRRHAQESL